jgi:nitrate reductase (cytochrome), electron transfer subunit
MSAGGPRTPLFLLGGFLAACLVVAVVAGRVVLRRAAQAEPNPAPEPGSELLAPSDRPIASESEVFRTSPAVLAIPPSGGRQRDAHPRSLASYRFLRAYPGAPPRIPHGFTADEFRSGTCNTCHRRGGYSPRFNAYVPVTPHPDMPACLQCHVGRDEVTGVSLPNLDPSTICRQCHIPGAAMWADRLVDWRPMAWPVPERHEPDGGPPPISHDLFFRGNCLACHSGPSAVAEIRTTHPEWVDCRQCHVTPDATVGEFIRPLPSPPMGKGG